MGKAAHIPPQGTKRFQLRNPYNLISFHRRPVMEPSQSGVLPGETFTFQAHDPEPACICA
jgi:hypothetical protein